MANSVMDRHERTAARAPMRVLVEYQRLDDFLADYTANLSLGGMFVKTNCPLEPGTHFRLRFQIPGHSRTVETFGEVRWVVPPDEAHGMNPGMGVAFEALSTRDQNAVDRWLEEWK